MFHYFVKYADQGGEGKTTVSSSEPIDANEAAEAITEHLIVNKMPPDWVQIDEFSEIKNPVFGVYAETRRRLCDHK